MVYVEIIIKLIVGLSVLNVWLLRANKSTAWRGAGANSLEEEFKVYGLSPAIMKIVGAIKIVLSLLIIASIFYKPLILIGATGMAFMMAVAVAMHVKVKDPLKKSLPAFLFLMLSVVLLLLYGLG